MARGHWEKQPIPPAALKELKEFYKEVSYPEIHIASMQILLNAYS
jgi:hypothetical protein